MAIKKRIPQTEEQRAAAIAAFGNAATPESDAMAERPTHAAQRASRTSNSRSVSEPSGDVPSTSLIRWVDGDLPRAIQRIALEEDRSFHKTMLQLLRRGVDDYNGER